MIKRPEFLKRIFYIINYFPKNNFCKNVAKKYNINGYKRIYHYHIRKTGGTSVNRMFLFLNKNEQEISKIRKEIHKSKLHLAVDKEKRIYVGFNKYLLEKGDYFYGFSHFAQHELEIPEDTFTFTVLRDPLERLISHYRMIKEQVQKDSKHPFLRREKGWLGNNFSEFLDNIPKEHLMRQLFMFSKDFNVEEAMINIKKCSHVIFLDEFEQGVKELFNKIKLDTPDIFHERKGEMKIDLTEEEIEKANRMLSKEIDWYKKLKNDLRN